MEIQNTKIVAIVGRPNVGKSALFNRLAGKNIAIVHDRPGVTRDRLIASCRKAEPPFDIMDTGGIGETIEDDFNLQVKAEATLALDVADVILFVVDGFQGVTPVDLELAKTLRQSTKPLILVVNKMDSEKRKQHGSEFSKLGFKEIHETSAAHGHGITELIATVGKHLNSVPAKATRPPRTATAPPLKLAIIGRPNAGKSSLVNALIGDQRTIVSDIAGTTRDSIDIPYEHDGKAYTLIDTAGLRRKAKIHDAVETFSAQQATRSIKRADLCVLLVDASGMTMQDRKVAQIVVELQKPCIIVLNKFDLYHPGAKLKDRKEELLETARREFFFMPHAPMIPISAKEGQYLDKIFNAVERVHHGAQNPPGTGALNRILHKVIDTSPAALGRTGKSFNLLYASFIKEDNPAPIPVPHIVLFANRVDKLQDSFLRHLESVLRKTWPAEGIPMRWSIRGKGKKKDLETMPAKRSRKDITGEEPPPKMMVDRREARRKHAASDRPGRPDYRKNRKPR
ncbi:ribosome biogenesis GTPase Der [Phragmitibacter flavus]|uniref:GTPase Der n=1 Tax=Phragmitibacter flavus TaxID=2576071 RepID=A0A5R8KIY7_9BACT|nr:ribosome biogenesis GTPase Der [Phragmitibacter flavus]TLD71579.1 ribosome biogenesis GTPase Der [Phragmitibacter flavus]